MNLPLVILALIAAVFAPFVASPVDGAEPKHLFKMATIAPEGSIWTKRFSQFDEEVRKKTGGEVGFRLYSGGAMGDDRAVLRKMKIGQLHGAGLAMTGISEVVPDFRVMSIPFTFTSYQEADAVCDGLLPEIRRILKDKGFYLLATSEVGFVYPLSTTPIASVADLVATKCWAPDGDPLSQRFLELAGIQPISLSIADVLTSLQTGMINTVFNGYYGSLVLQWFTRIRYVADTPFSYAYGAMLINLRDMEKLTPEQTRAVEAAAAAVFTDKLHQDTRQSNVESRQTLLANNVKEVTLETEAKARFLTFRESLVKEATGKLFSAEIYEQMGKILTAARSGSK